jgi:hypothetical protein
MANKFDLTPHVAKRQHVPMTGRDGKRVQVPTTPGMDNPHDRTHLGEHLDPKAGGKPKNHGPNPIHGGMTAQQQKMAGVGGLSLDTIASAPVADPASPVSLEPQGKILKPVAISPGMKNRTSPGMTSADHKMLGRAILDAAVKN